LVHHVPFELVAWEFPVWEGFVTGMARARHATDLW